MPGDAHELAARLRAALDGDPVVLWGTTMLAAAAELERLAGENAAMKAHMEALRQQTCPCYLYTDPDCPYLSSAGPPQEAGTHSRECAVWGEGPTGDGATEADCTCSAGPPQGASLRDARIERARQSALAAYPDPPSERRCTCGHSLDAHRRRLTCLVPGCTCDGFDDPASPEHGRG